MKFHRIYKAQNSFGQDIYKWQCSHCGATSQWRGADWAPTPNVAKCMSCALICTGFSLPTPILVDAATMLAVGGAGAPAQIFAGGISSHKSGCQCNRHGLKNVAH